MDRVMEAVQRMKMAVQMMNWGRNHDKWWQIVLAEVAVLQSGV